MKNQAVDNLKAIAKILDNLGVEFLLDGGTLLGAYRDGDFCLDDEDDVDLTTLHSADIAGGVVAAAEKQGFKLEHRWSRTETRRTGHYFNAQIALRRNGVKVDLMFKEIYEDYAYWCVYGNQTQVYKKVPARFYQETDTIKFYGGVYWRPKDIEDYLTYRYGDWKTPVHRSKYSCYTSDKSIVGNSYEDL